MLCDVQVTRHISNPWFFDWLDLTFYLSAPGECNSNRELRRSRILPPLWPAKETKATWCSLKERPSPSRKRCMRLEPPKCTCTTTASATTTSSTSSCRRKWQSKSCPSSSHCWRAFRGTRHSAHLSVSTRTSFWIDLITLKEGSSRPSFQLSKWWIIWISVVLILISRSS